MSSHIAVVKDHERASSESAGFGYAVDSRFGASV
jgi:hypothetical protein